MGAVGYWWERFCFATFAPYLVWIAATNPAYYGHLTYWTLALHAVYFTIDKASPHSATLTYLLHGMSFAGAIAIFIGYALISIGGTYRFGSWLTWENAVGAKAGTVHHDRGLNELAIQKAYEHVWPVFASVLDVYFSKSVLLPRYAGLPKKRTTLLAVGSFLAFGTVWELTDKATVTPRTHSQPGRACPLIAEGAACASLRVTGQGLPSRRLRAA